MWESTWKYMSLIWELLNCGSFWVTSKFCGHGLRIYLSFWIWMYLHAIGRFPCKANLLLFSRGYNQNDLLTSHRRSIDEWCCIAYLLQTMGDCVWRRQCCFCWWSARLVSLILVQQQLQLGEADGVLEHCFFLCATLTNSWKVVRYNWVEEPYNNRVIL